MTPEEISAEERAMAEFRERDRRWRMACEAVRRGIIRAEEVPLDAEMVGRYVMRVPALRQMVESHIRSSLGAPMLRHVEISAKTAAGIDAADTAAKNREDVPWDEDFWRGLGTRLAEAEREYP